MRTLQRRSLLLAAAVSLLAIGPAEAGTIRMSITTDVEYRDGSFKLDLTLANSGNDEADAVVPVVTCGNRTARGQGVRRLLPGQTVKETIRIDAGALAEGRWPCWADVSYSDSNGFPYQAFHLFLAEVGSPPPAKVLTSMEAIEPFDDAGVAFITVRNLDVHRHQVTLKAVVSPNLSVSPSHLQLDIAENGTRKLPIELSNRRAKPGSALPVLVTVEYDAAPYHHTSMATGGVRIIPPRPFLVRHKITLMVGGAALAIAALGAALLRRFRGRAST